MQDQSIKNKIKKGRDIVLHKCRRDFKIYSIYIEIKVQNDITGSHSLEMVQSVVDVMKQWLSEFTGRVREKTITLQYSYQNTLNITF